ncbi:MAG TPA: LysR substrate-binding domain-containing protein, partial [Limnobacter sp.]|nr:LysR substrate-binding domain-containing protein [Limnobacter sp.]
FFYEHAVRLMAQAGELVNMTKRLGKIDQKFSLGFVGSTLFGLLPEVVRRFKAANPGLEVSLHEMTTMEQIQALKDGVIDVGIGRIRKEDAKVKRTVLRNEELVAALPMGHRLAHSTGAVKLADLLQDILVVFPKNPRPSFADQVLDAFKDRGMTVFRVQEARDLQVALLLVAAGVGVSIVPKSVTGMKRSDIVYKPLDEVDLTSPVIMSTRIYDQSETIQSFLNVVYGLYRSEGIPYIKPEKGE